MAIQFSSTYNASNHTVCRTFCNRQPWSMSNVVAIIAALLLFVLTVATNPAHAQGAPIEQCNATCGQGQDVVLPAIGVNMPDEMGSTPKSSHLNHASKRRAEKRSLPRVTRNGFFTTPL